MCIYIYIYTYIHSTYTQIHVCIRHEFFTVGVLCSVVPSHLARSCIEQGGAEARGEARYGVVEWSICVGVGIDIGIGVDIYQQ